MVTTARKATTKYDALVKEDRVHGDAFLRADIFEEELERVFHKGWVFVGHESEVAQPGDYKLTWIGRQSVIMSRDEAGEVHLLFNRCMHRANAVCQYDQGNANFFRCAYHGWTYKNDGSLVGVTYQNGYPDWFRKEEWGLRKVARVASYRGFIFGSMSPEGISLEEHPGGPAMEQIDLFCDLSPEGEVVARSGSHKDGYNANWKFQMENTIDGYHPNFAHQAFFDIAGKTMGPGIDQLFRGDSPALVRDLGHGHSCLDSRPFSQKMAEEGGAGRMQMMMAHPDGKAYFDGLVKRLGAERAKEVLIAGGCHMFIWPNLFLLGVQIRVTQPIAVDRTEVYVYPTLLKGAPDMINTMRLRQHEVFYGPAGGGRPDDIEMFERSQMGLQCQVDPWLLITRGTHRERTDVDGTIVSQVTDEVPMRGMWRHWKKVMSAERPEMVS